MKEITIKLENNKWLINGKQYKDLSYPEKVFFDEFLIAIRINFEASKNTITT